MRDHPVSPIKHRMTRRAHHHDYERPGAYMLTFRLKKEATPVSDISLAFPVPYRPDGGIDFTKITNNDVKTILPPAGQAIHDAILAYIAKYPDILSHDGLVVMPDHIHLILHVRARLERKFYWHMSQLMGSCSRAFWQVLPNHLLSKTHTGIFEKGFNDSIIYDEDQFRAEKAYVAANPRKLFIARTARQYFYNTVRLRVDGRLHDAYGNFYLLRHPHRVPVIVSSRYSAEELSDWQELWRDTARHGGVLVGAFISEKEKAVMEECRELGAKFIMVSQTGFGDRYKPTGGFMELCAEGRLMQIGFEAYSTQCVAFTREQCLARNDFARRLCELTPADALSILADPSRRQEL